MAAVGWCCGAVALLMLRDMGLAGWACAVGLVMLTAGIGTMIHLGIVSPALRRAAIERRLRTAADNSVDSIRKELGFVDRLNDSLDAARSESDVIEALRWAMVTLLPDSDHMLVLCDTSGALAHSIDMRSDGFGDPRHLSRPTTCPALVTGTTTCAASSSDMATCPHVSFADGESSSVCIPMRAPGLDVGIVRSVGAAGDLPEPMLLHRLERSCLRATAKIHALRAASSTKHAVPSGAPGAPELTDGMLEINGEVDRGTVERVALALIGRVQPFSLAMCALDERDPLFDELDPGWRSRSSDLLGEVLDDTLRPTDVIGRTSETFMLLLPDADRGAALAALERVRENLVLRLTEAEVDPFSISIGVAESIDAAGLGELIESAELALLVATRQGGNRVRAWTDGSRRDHGAISPTD